MSDNDRHLASVPSGVLSLSLRNIRAFNELELKFSTADGAARKRTLLIGANGTGKSTILRTIVLGLADKSDLAALSGMPIGGLVRHHELESTIRVNHDGNWSEINLLLDSSHSKELVNAFESPSSDIPLVCAYGANRGHVTVSSPRPLGSPRLTDSAASLFNQPVPLIAAEMTLRRLGDFLRQPEYDSVINGLRQIFDLEEDVEIKLRKGGGVDIESPREGTIALEAWADGFRLTFEWLTDFIGRALESGAILSDGSIRGILLIDEIELHLHPKLQTGILDKISRLFPKVQIIATTHSPIVATGCNPGELISLSRTVGGDVQATVPQSFQAFSVEDILTDDDLFGASAYGKETEAGLLRYRALASKTQRTAQESTELNELTRQLQPPGGGDTRVMDALAEIRELVTRQNRQESVRDQS